MGDMPARWGGRWVRALSMGLRGLGSVQGQQESQQVCEQGRGMARFKVF